MPRFRRLTLALSLLAATGAITAGAIYAAGGRITHIASPVGGSPSADGPSANPVWSQDGRDPRLFAYDSAATNLTAGDTNGTRDVFVLKRTPGEGNLSGTLVRASVNSQGQGGNGPSLKPSLDGQGDKVRPHCVAFESTATNLDPRDKTGDSDIFLRDLKTNKTTLVSTGNYKDAHNAKIDGECNFVIFEDAGKIWGRDLRKKIKEKKGKVGQVVFIAQGTNPDIETDGKGTAYERNNQVYYQGFRFEFRRGFVTLGKQKLVSSTPSGAPGNGISSNPDLDDLGRYVAFESTATNLCGDCTGVQGDRNGAVSDVFRRTISREAPTKDRMQMVSYSQGCSSSSPSAKTIDQQGNGPSHNPVMTGAGENVVFDSEADNLKESTGIRVADANGHTQDIFYWNFPRGRRCGNVSRESRSDGDRSAGQSLNGNSYEPALSQRANYIAYVSEQTGEFEESNGSTIPDVFTRFLGGQ
ncbi:MAG TPA: hypothetical protein VE570_10925 [Thermoleophilaceae bacterium]|nr:hypothetical protein [Thermoleophilaceae bacterium]